MTALQSVTVFACMRLLCSNVASLPLSVYKRTPNGREKATNHAAHTLLHDAPNPNLSSFDLLSLIVAHLLMYGNSYLYKETVGSTVIALWPLKAPMMKIAFDPTGKLIYEYGSGSEKKLFTNDQIIHFRMLSLDGIEGLSPISYARNAIGLSLQMERFGSSLYKNNLKPSGVLRHPSALTPEGAKRLQESFAAQYSGSENVGKMMLLEDGLTYEAMSLTPEDASYIASRQLSTEELCRVFNCPTHLLGINNKPTYASVESEKESFLTFTLRPILSAIERTFNNALFSGTDFYCRFTVADFLRSNIENRYKAYSIGIQNGFLSPNEVRSLEELNDRDGGSEFLSPLNMRVGTTTEGSSDSSTAK